MLDWPFGSREATVTELVERKSFGKAISLLRKQFEAGSRVPELRMQLADILLLDDREAEAIPIYLALADELGRSGQTAKAAAILKKVDRVAPGLKDVELRLAVLAERAPGSSPEPPPVAGASIVANPLFASFSREELAAVLRGLRLLTFEPGDIVVAEGEPGESLFLISSGAVKAFVKSPSGRYVEVRKMEEGDFFGEISVLKDQPRSATVIAALPCELLELDRPTVSSIAALHPKVREVLEAFCRERANSSVEAIVRGMKFGPPS